MKSAAPQKNTAPVYQDSTNGQAKKPKKEIGELKMRNFRFLNKTEIIFGKDTQKQIDTEIKIYRSM